MTMLFKSVVLYAVPGVLVIGGCWWWYRSQKEAGLTSHDSEVIEDTGLLASPNDVSTESDHLTTGDQQDAAMLLQDPMTTKQKSETKDVVAVSAVDLPELRVDLAEGDDVLSSFCEDDQCARPVIGNNSCPISARAPVSDSSEELQLQENMNIISQPAESCEETMEMKLLDSLGEGSSRMVDRERPAASITSRTIISEAGLSPGSTENLKCPGESCSQFLRGINVPQHLVSRFIGKNGEHVKTLMDRSGTKINVTTWENTKFQVCHVEGTQRQIDIAAAMIEEWFQKQKWTLLCVVLTHRCNLSLPSFPH